MLHQAVGDGETDAEGEEETIDPRVDGIQIALGHPLGRACDGADPDGSTSNDDDNGFRKNVLGETSTSVGSSVVARRHDITHHDEQLVRKIKRGLDERRVWAKSASQSCFLFFLQGRNPCTDQRAAPERTQPALH